MNAILLVAALKVLAIGNSFSVCTHHCLPDVARDLGCELDLVTMTIGGCPLDRHWNCLTNAADLSYFLQWNRGGNAKAAWPELAVLVKPVERFVRKTQTREWGKGANLEAVLKAVPWDVITIQQASSQSWQAETYRPWADDLCKSIKKLSPRAEIVVQETWSYTPWDGRLARWGIDQNGMYAKLHRAYLDFAASKGFRVIPTGTAVQLWRERLPVVSTENSFGGDVCGGLGKSADQHFAQKDGKWKPVSDVSHFNEDGHYLQALVWAAKLFGADVTKVRYAPDGLPAEKARLMREVAMAAVRGEPVPVSRGGVAIPPAVAAGMARVRAAQVTDGEIVEVAYRPGGLRVAYVLRPTPKSYIRCELGLPDPAAWDGRLWGYGNGGWAGGVSCPWPKTSAAVTTDMGTSRYRIDENPCEREVLTDFGWRSTHLMTVEAKKLVAAYYGKGPHHSYFTGCSTGGGQGLCEVQRFPEDYDGVIAGVPGNDRLSRATGRWQEMRLAEKFGRTFTSRQIETIAKAELDYFAAKDPACARGRFIWNPEPTKENLDGCWRTIVAADPSLADCEAHWRALFDDVVIDGRRLEPGPIIGFEFHQPWTFMLEKYVGPRPEGKGVSAEEMFAFADNREIRFVDPDIGAFAKRGGKLITYAGLWDVCIPPRPVTEYFESVARQFGGTDKAQAFMLHYLIPGRKHCVGSPANRGFAGAPKDLDEKLIAWVEKGVRPDELTVPFVDDLAEPIVIRPYPKKN